MVQDQTLATHHFALFETNLPRVFSFLDDLWRCYI